MYEQRNEYMSTLMSRRGWPSSASWCGKEGEERGGDGEAGGGRSNGSEATVIRQVRGHQEVKFKRNEEKGIEETDPGTGPSKQLAIGQREGSHRSLT